MLWAYGILTASVSICLPMFDENFGFLAARRGPLHVPLAHWIAIALWVGFCCRIAAVFRRKWEAEKLRRANEPPQCRECGYILIGLPEPRCPECGRAFDPELITWTPAADQEGAHARSTQ